MGKRRLFPVFWRTGGRGRRKNAPPECPRTHDFEARGNLAPLAEKECFWGRSGVSQGRTNGDAPPQKRGILKQGGIEVFFKVSIAGTDTGRIIEQMRKAVQLVGKRGELDCRLADNSVVTIHADRSVTISYPPLRFQPNGEPERRRILAREVLESIV